MITQASGSLAQAHQTPSHSARTYVDRESLSPAVLSIFHLSLDPTMTGLRRDFLESANALSLRPRILFANDRTDQEMKCRLFDRPSDAHWQCRLFKSWPQHITIMYRTQLSAEPALASVDLSHSRRACNLGA